MRFARQTRPCHNPTMDENRYPQRKSPRLQDYDYSQDGAYFVTICTHQKRHLFGKIADGVMMLNRMGNIAASYWAEIPNHHGNVELDLYVVMPNHVHGIVIINHEWEGGYKTLGNAGAEYIPPVMKKRPQLSTIIATYKAAVTRKIKNSDLKIWQRSYHDHIIRNESSLNKIREYVLNNPALWEKDRFYSGVK
jgi:putative transposase